MRKSRGIAFTAWLVDPKMDMRDLIKHIPLSVWAQGYIDNLTTTETEKRYNEEQQGKRNGKRKHVMSVIRSRQGRNT